MVVNLKVKVKKKEGGGKCNKGCRLANARECFRDSVGRLGAAMANLVGM